MRTVSIFFFSLILLANTSFSQTAWFIDGYHGGIYGHLPPWQTKFMVEKLAQYPDWKLNLELEPESWDTIAIHDTAAYTAFQKLFADQSANGRIEYVNPAYAQPYMYNISGESIIRQLYYGMKKLRQHFPTAVFSTYSSEEPCFTSALPQILRSYGFKYASLKNPNTCWGGYTRAFGGELVNWTGPDGSAILTVPRYGIEALKPQSIWETIASSNSKTYIEKAFASGIRHPIGMCLQDAGWAFGPWLRGNYYTPTVYQTWRGYMQTVSNGQKDRTWKFSQEDVLVSLMWGSQVLQRIAREVRTSEQKIIIAEKLAAMTDTWLGKPWPTASFDAAWRTLLLSQHHDCWIVPYNGKPGDTWADKVVAWTGNTDRRSDSITRDALLQLSGSANSELQYIRVFNTTAVKRIEFVQVALPEEWEQATLLDRHGMEITGQPLPGKQLLFKVTAPSMGYATYRLKKQGILEPLPEGAVATRLPDGIYKIETDLYRILLDPAKGGTIQSWVTKTAGNREFIQSGKNFNELRGNFYNAGGFRSSTETPAEIRILENGPKEVKVEIKGSIADNPFTQLITVRQGQARVDAHLSIDWKGNPAIGEYADNPKDNQTRKAYYDDRYKLLALFPVNFPSQKIYKNAPFDVTESHLTNTFFNSWDSIKNNIILNWVDVEDATGKIGMTLFCDHTTSYAHGKDLPLGLTVQYSGNGIFYRDYKIDGATEMNYAWLPHAGKWDQAGVWTEGTKWNEPLQTTFADANTPAQRSLLELDRPGMEVSSLTQTDGHLLVRLFNAEGDSSIRKIYLGFAADTATEVALNGDRIKYLPIRLTTGGRRYVELSMPRFGIRTIQFITLQKN